MKGDEESEYRIIKPICCSVNTFLCANYLYAVLALGLVGVGAVGLILNEGIFIVLPPATYFGAVGLGAFALLVILCGVVGQKQRVEICFLVYLLLLGIALVAQTLGFSFLFLYANDVGTLQTLDAAAINAQETFEKNLITYAQDNAANWIETQDTFECCGIDFEIRVDDEVDPLEVETGALCSDLDALLAIAELEILLDAYLADPDGEQIDEFGNFLPAFEDETVGAETAFFCKFRLAEILQENTLYFGLGLGFILFIQAIALVAGARLYWVPEFLGGWMFDDEELELMAKMKGIDFPKQSTIPPGNGVIANIRNQTNRLSFRVQNAYTADPNAPKDAGFIQRLSMRNIYNQPEGKHMTGGMGRFPHQGPGIYNAQRPPAPPPKGNFMKRLSNRFLGAGGGINFGPPPGLNGRESEESRGFSGKMYTPAALQGPPAPPKVRSNPDIPMTLRSLEMGANSGRFNPQMPPEAPPSPPPSFTPALGFTPQTPFSPAPPPPPTFERNESKNSFQNLRKDSKNSFQGYNSNRSNFNPPPMASRQESFPQAPAPPRKFSKNNNKSGNNNRFMGKKKSSKAAVRGGGGPPVGGLLGEIHKGAKLKKAVTVDKSGPRI